MTHKRPWFQKSTVPQPPNKKIAKVPIWYNSRSESENESKPETVYEFKLETESKSENEFKSKYESKSKSKSESESETNWKEQADKFARLWVKESLKNKDIEEKFQKIENEKEILIDKIKDLEDQLIQAQELCFTDAEAKNI